MSELTKHSFIDQVELVNLAVNPTMQVRVATQVLEGDKVLSQSFSRYTVQANDSVADQPAIIQRLHNAVFSA